MKVSKNENEIIIKIKKEDLIFNKLNQVENIYKFKKYYKRENKTRHRRMPENN